MSRLSRLIMILLLVAPAVFAASPTSSALGQKTIVLKGHVGGVWGVAPFPNGKALLTSGDDGTVRLWETITGKHMRKTVVHNCKVLDVAIAPNGRWMATAGLEDQTIKVWNIKTARLFRSWKVETKRISVAFSSDSKRVYSGGWGNIVTLHDVTRNKRLKTWKIGSRVAASLDGKYAAILSSGPRKRGALRLLDVKSFAFRWEKPDSTPAGAAVAFSPDSKWLATGYISGQIRLWSVDRGKWIKEWTLHSQQINNLTFTPDSKFAYISVRSDRKICVVDTQTKKIVTHIPVGDNPKRNLVITIALPE